MQGTEGVWHGRGCLWAGKLGLRGDEVVEHLPTLIRGATCTKLVCAETSPNTRLERGLISTRLTWRRHDVTPLRKGMEAINEIKEVCEVGTAGFDDFGK